MKWRVPVMPLKTSYFKKELWKQGFRSSGWIGIAYFIGLLFIMPLMILMQITSPDGYYGFDSVEGTTLFDINGYLQMMLLIFVPILASVFSFRYMQVKGSSDFIHSLPITRGQIFIQQFLIGLSNIVLPVLANAVIIYFIKLGFQLNIYTIGDIAWWIQVTLIFSLLLYSFTSLIGVLTGISIVQAGLTYIFLFFPIGIYMLVTFNLELLLKGFTMSYAAEDFMIKLSPFIAMIDYLETNSSPAFLWIYFAVSILFIFLSIILYRVRNAEAANQALAFSVIKPIFRIGVTICFMLSGGFYFGITQGSMLGWIIFGYFFGAFLGYTLAEMLIQKTWRVFNQYKGLLVYMGISILLLISVVFDWYGYEKRIPQNDNVEGVYIEDTSNRIFNFGYSNSNEIKPNITTPELIEHVTKLHELIIDSNVVIQNPHRFYSEYSTEIKLTYFMKNGGKMTRSYFIEDYRELEEYLLPVFESDSYIKSIFDWIEGQNYKQLQLEGTKGSISIKDRKVMNNLLSALEEDYLLHSYEKLRKVQEESSNYLVFESREGDMFHLPISLQFENLIQVLIKHNMGHLLPLEAKDYSMVAISNQLEDRYDMYNLPYEEDIRREWLIFEQKNEIEELIQLKDSDSNNNGNNYYIAFYDKVHDGFLYSVEVEKETLPDFVKSRLHEIE